MVVEPTTSDAHGLLMVGINQVIWVL
jgi:hypothetical protein